MRRPSLYTVCGSSPNYSLTSTPDGHQSCVYMHAGIPVLSLVLFLIIFCVHMEQEKPGCLYFRIRDNNSIQVSDRLPAGES